MKNWNDRKTSKKGTLAEKIVENKILVPHNKVFYKAISEGRHPFDYLIYDYVTHIIIPSDVKAKPKMDYYNGSGIDYKHYLKYKEISKNINKKFFIFFVDECMGEIYGNYICELEKEVLEPNENNRKYPYIFNTKGGDRIILFHMDNMKRNLYKITENEITELKALNTRNYSYKD